MGDVRVGLFPTVAPLTGGEELSLRSSLARRRSALTISASAIM
jgi:hypothetical protein